MNNRYLLKTTEVWRVPTVEDALRMHDELDASPDYDMTSFAYTTKYDKKVEEEYQIVTVKKFIQAEKALARNTTVEYHDD